MDYGDLLLMKAPDQSLKQLDHVHPRTLLFYYLSFVIYLFIICVGFFLITGMEISDTAVLCCCGHLCMSAQLNIGWLLYMQ